MPMVPVYTSFTYDDNGNRTQKTKGTDNWVYTYDYANRLSKVEENSATVEEYVYDGDGKRIQVTDSSKTTIYIYSGLNVLYEETMNSAATYIYGPVGRIAKRITINQETNTYYYHTDHIGSTRLATDDNKNIVAHTVYHPFGEPYSTEGSQDYSFTGKKQDATGLYYVSARYYDPELGRFLTRDLKKGINQYSYCYNNPLKYIDPDGCEPTRWIFTDTCMPPSETEMQHPHVIYWMGKPVKNDYRAYGYFCFVSGINTCRHGTSSFWSYLGSGNDLVDWSEP
jgi:RHS repeat-associated protein